MQARQTVNVTLRNVCDVTLQNVGEGVLGLGGEVGGKLDVEPDDEVAPLRRVLAHGKPLARNPLLRLRGDDLADGEGNPVVGVEGGNFRAEAEQRLQVVIVERLSLFYWNLR